jgi:sugar/nucleoside kinase (ribokinase family)
VSVVSSIGRDYPSNFLSRIKQHGIDVTGVKKFDGLTTRFRISYRGDSRRLELIHPGRKLKPGSIPSSFRAIHIGPVFMEAGLDTLSYARRHSRFLSVDLQGLLRTPGQRGLVRLVRRRIDPFFAKCNLVKATEEEIRVIASGKTLISTAKRFLHKGPQYVVITRGRSSSLLVRKDGGTLQIPSFPESRVVDMTGAGDIFIGSWLATFLSVGDASWAGAVGAAFASLSIQGVGVSKFRFARGELFRRASWVYRNLRLVEG